MSNRSNKEAVRLARLFKALSSSKRVELLGLLERGCCDGSTCCTAEKLSLCVESLAERLGLVKSTVSHHLKELGAAGLISQAKKGRHNELGVNRDILKRAAAFLDRLAGCLDTARCRNRSGRGDGDGTP